MQMSHCPLVALQRVAHFPGVNYGATPRVNVYFRLKAKRRCEASIVNESVLAPFEGLGEST